MFSLHIETDNDAFHDNPKGEIARILLSLAASLNKQNWDGRGGRFDGFQNLFDYNGNNVGSAELTIVNSRPQPQGRYHR